MRERDNENESECMGFQIELVSMSQRMNAPVPDTLDCFIRCSPITERWRQS